MGEWRRSRLHPTEASIRRTWLGALVVGQFVIIDRGPLRGLKNGGEGGIRTLDGYHPIHTFQACSFGRSDTSPDSVAPRMILEVLK